MRSGRRAAIALYGFLALVTAGCHRGRSAPITPDARTRLYAAVLQELQPDTVRWVVIDTLMPSRDIDAELREKVLSVLRISSATLEGFLAVQRLPADQFRPAMLPGARFVPLRAAQLDSMRRAVRDDITRGAAERGPNNDLFWRRWSATFPASGGYVILSPAMISADGREAMVQVRVICGSVCGTAEVRHLRRDTSGAWYTTATVRLSES